jgi:heme ABC exporter ATP-binding subunit CcmA
VIEIEQLVKEFGRKRVIGNVNMKIDSGEFVVILGPNGAGKTTLLRLISTLLRPSSGRILVDGNDVKDEGIEVRQKVGVLAHVPYLYEELSAIENLRFYAKMYGIGPADERIKDLLERVKLSHRMNDQVGTFSRGMKQRLAIARAIIQKPNHLFMDEPYTGLDLNGCSILSEMLRRFHRQKRTIVMVTHDMERGYEMGERLAVMIDGDIAYDVRKDTVSFDEFKESYKNLLGAT